MKNRHKDIEGIVRTIEANKMLSDMWESQRKAKDKVDDTGVRELEGYGRDGLQQQGMKNRKESRGMGNGSKRRRIL